MPPVLIVLPLLAAAAYLLLGGGGVDRAAHVAAAFAGSKGARYSWGGGHTPPIRWPIGGRGLNGGIGWDCSGWVSAVVARASSPPRWAARPLGSGDIWRSVGSPRNGAGSGRPGDLIFWSFEGRPVHVGFIIAPGWAVSAMGRGSSVNGDDPTQIVKLHTFRGAGLPVLGTASW